MTTMEMKTKVLRLEAQVKSIKMALGRKPDLGVDEKVWRAVRPILKTVRRDVFRRVYGA